MKALAKHSYFVICALVVILIGIVTVRHQWLSDWWIHLATVREAARHPVHPLDPLTGTDSPFPYYSPYTLGLGQISRFTGIDAATLLEVAGLLCVVALLAGLRYFVRSITDARQAPTLVLLFTLFLWGPGVLWWSGFYSFGSLSMGPGWPSVFAGGAMLLTLGAAWRWLDEARAGLVVILTLVPALIAIVHPFTGVLTGMAVLVTFLGRARRPGQFLMLVAIGASGILLVSLWPYWSFWALMRAPADFSQIHAPLYIEALARFGLILVCFPALWARLRGSARDPLVWWTVTGLALVLAGWVTGITSLGRAWPLAMLGAHTALGVHLCTRKTRARSWVVVAVAMLAGISGQLYGFVRILPTAQVPDRVRELTGLRVPYPDVGWMMHRVAPGDVVVPGSQFFTGRQLPASQVFAVLPPWPDPLLPGEAKRAQGRLDILGTDSRARRKALKKWNVRWVVTAPGHRWSGAGPDGELVEIGPDGSLLYRTSIG